MPLTCSVYVTGMSTRINILKPAEVFMTDSDWFQLRKVFSLVKPKKGEYIIRQGDTETKLYQLLRGDKANSYQLTVVGECKVTKTVPGEGEVEGETLKNEIFGHMSFLEGGPRTANVIAATDDVEVI